jgi:hypothetical protein
MHNLVFENDQDLQAFDSRFVATQDCVCSLFTHEPFASKLQPMTFKVEVDSKGGSKVPMVPTKMDKVVHLEGATNSVSAKSDNPHTGIVFGHSEGLKNKQYEFHSLSIKSWFALTHV